MSVAGNSDQILDVQNFDKITNRNFWKCDTGVEISSIPASLQCNAGVSVIF